MEITYLTLEAVQKAIEALKEQYGPSGPPDDCGDDRFDWDCYHSHLENLLGTDLRGKMYSPDYFIPLQSTKLLKDWLAYMNAERFGFCEGSKKGMLHEVVDREVTFRERAEKLANPCKTSL